MKVTVSKSEIKGKVGIPPSKSMTIRALMCAALSMGKSEIVHPLVSEDTNAAAAVLGKIGVGVQKETDVWRVTGGTLRAHDGDLYCGESATTLRFMTAICSLIPGKHRLVGGASLSKRPVKSLVEALKKLGINGSTEGKTTPPVIIEGGTYKGGLTEIPGNISSQFVSALFLIAPFAPKETSIKLTTSLTSKPYILMTLWCLKKFGINVQTEWDRFIIKRQKYQPARLTMEGDWSSASYFLALGAVSGGIQVDNLSSTSLQGDRVILDMLRSMGVMVRVAGNSVIVSQNKLKGIRADLSDCIDLLPTMAVLASLAEGISVFTGIERARIKESNRVSAIKEGLQKIGVPVAEERDRLTITGLKTPKKVKDDYEEKEKDEGEGKKDVKDEAAKEPVVIESYGDHRIAMAFAVLGIAIGGIIINEAECVAKTFPDFWEVLKSVGGKLEIDAK